MTPLRVASLLAWINGVGFGVFCPPAIANVARGRAIPIVLGFPAYGGGPFEKHGLPTTVPLLTGFLLVCLLECAAGYLLWNAHPSGAVLALALLPAGAVFWWGFALPIAWLFGLARTTLVVLGWQALR